MSITAQQRKEGMLKASDAIYDAYGNPELGSHISVWIKQLALTNEIQDALIHCIGDTILGFYQTKDLPNLLVQEVGVTPEVSQKIVADLAEFFAPVLEREAAMTNPKANSLKALHQSFIKSARPAPAAEQPMADPDKPPIAVPGAAEPTAEPASVHDVTPMRTMAADMSRVHGYGAYRQTDTEASTENVIKSAPQDELLKERPRLTGVPTVGD